MWGRTWPLHLKDYLYSIPYIIVYPWLTKRKDAVQVQLLKLLSTLVKIKPLACCLSHWLGRSSWLSAKRMQDTHDLHATAQQDMDGEWASIISLSIYIMWITCILDNTSPVSRRSRFSSLDTCPTADCFWQPLLRSTALYQHAISHFVNFWLDLNLFSRTWNLLSLRKKISKNHTRWTLFDPASSSYKQIHVTRTHPS